jgi:isoleucyl-tRNA synthetase
MRWFLVGSPILRGANLAIEKDGKDIAKSTRDVLLPLWNAFHYFCLYANSENIQAEYNTASENVLDQYILAKTRELVEDIQRNMDAYEAGLACQCITRFMDVLNNWYIRRSRNRFWVGTGHEDAFNTLYTVLHILTRTLAPFVPLTSEYIFKALSGARSVHLEDWPNVADVPARKELITTMDRIREICSLTKGIRETHKLRNRLPLATLTVAGRDLDALRPFFDLIADEVNVKTVNIRDDLDAVADNLLYVFTPKVGKRLGKNMKAVMAASRTGDWTLTPAGTIEIAGEVLNPGEFDVRLQPKEGVAGEAVSDNTALVMLDVHVTPELEQEGLARDFVRIVQEGRKTANLNISDRIVLNATVATDGPEAAALRTHADYICEQVLGNSLNVTIGTPTDGQSLGDTSVALTITVAA